MSGETAISILRRLIDSDQADLPPAMAQAVLRLHFDDADQARIDELATKSNAGFLTPEECTEYDEYIAVADLLSLWKSKARLALQNHPSAA